MTLAVLALLASGAWATIAPPPNKGGNQIVAHTGQESPPPNIHTGQERDDDAPDPSDTPPDDPSLGFGFNGPPIDIQLALSSTSTTGALPPPAEEPLLPVDLRVPASAPLGGLGGPSFGRGGPGDFSAPTMTTPVPAPGTLLLLGLAGLLGRRRRRRNEQD